MKRRMFSSALVSGLLPFSRPAHAQASWPAERPITLIVPYGAGGAVDATSRLLGQELARRLQQSVLVENVTGAAGVMGVSKAVQARPDGYTFVMGADSPIAIAGFVNPAVVKYDAAKNLAPVVLANTSPMVLVARPGLPANNLTELLTLARAQPGKLSYATSGIGTVLHLAMELIKERGKVDITHVPYRGGAQIASDVIGGQVDLGVLVSVTAAPHVSSGKMKALAVTDRTRSTALPGVPTVAESPGFGGFAISAWTGIFAPAQTPAAIVERMNKEVNDILKLEEVRARMTEQGATPGGGTAAEFTRFVAQERSKYEQIVRSAHIKE